ncbi:MAG: DnaJ domain-containing protein [Alkalispirochaetaceae bacterium]
MARRAKDHYDTLGVPRNADGETIRKAYRKKAKQHHPDAGTGADPAAFQAAQAAYEELKDPDRRRAYDLELRRREARPDAARGGTGFDSPHAGQNPFTSPFGTDTGRRESARPGRPGGSKGGPAGRGGRGGPGSFAGGGSGGRGMEELFNQEDKLFGSILRELFGEGAEARPGGGTSGFGGFGDMFSDPEGQRPFGPPRGGHRHLRDMEPMSVVVHLSPDESYTGGTVSVDLGAGRSILASIPPGVRDGQVVRSEFVDREGPRELKLHIRII